MAATKAAKAKASATKLHAAIVRARGQCENTDCGRFENLQCAHIVSRRYSATRTDLANALCLCAGCHMHFTEWPLEFAEFVNAKIGKDAYERLSLKALRSGKVDWELEVARLRPLLAAIEKAA